MKRYTPIILVAGLLAIAGCDQVKKLDEGSDTDGSGSLVPGPVQQRLTASCARPGCHVPGATGPDLSEASGGAWISQSGIGGPLVTFGDLDNSYLVQKLFPSPAAGSQMPSPPGMLSPEDLAIIVGWVAGVEFPEGGETTGGPSDTSGGPTTGTSADASSGSGDAEPALCSLEALAPGATNPIEAGDEADVIPTSVGEVLARNCGCHYSSDVTLPYTGAARMSTLAEFQGDYDGTAADYVGEPVWTLAQYRVVELRSMPYAPPICETEEEGNGITDADFAVLEAWFEQEIPDGASFTPPG